MRILIDRSHLSPLSFSARIFRNSSTPSRVKTSTESAKIGIEQCANFRCSHEKTCRTSNRSCCIWILKKALLFVGDFFRKHNLSYGVIYGTLLGAVRNQTLIPWTRDIDVFFFNKSYLFRPEIRNELYQHGYHVFEVNIRESTFDNDCIDRSDLAFNTILHSSSGVAAPLAPFDPTSARWTDGALFDSRLRRSIPGDTEILQQHVQVHFLFSWILEEASLADFTSHRSENWRRFVFHRGRFWGSSRSYVRQTIHAWCHASKTLAELIFSIRCCVFNSSDHVSHRGTNREDERSYINEWKRFVSPIRSHHVVQVGHSLRSSLPDRSVGLRHAK